MDYFKYSDLGLGIALKRQFSTILGDFVLQGAEVRPEFYLLVENTWVLLALS